MSNLKFCEKCQHGYLSEDGHDCPAEPRGANDVVPKGTTLVVGVWKLDDCDYVAANSKEEAVEWYERTILDHSVEEIEESSLDDEVNIAEEGEPVQLISNRQLITDELAKGKTLPMIVGTDPHYA